VLEPLLSILLNAITNNDYVMQLQLLNLLKVIFFQSSFTTKNPDSEVKPIIFRILASRLFIPNIIRGITTGISYVRA
jgi:TolB-like protein